MNRSTLLLSLVTLLVGGLLGFLVGRAGSTEGRFGGSGPTAPASGGRSEGADDPSPRPAPPPPSPGGNLAAAPAPADVETSGPGRIVGTVVDAAGEPLAGVRIVAEGRYRTPRAPGADPVDGSPPAEEGLREYAARYREAERVRRALRREAVTDGEGRFELTSLTDRDYMVRAYFRGYRLRPVGGGSWVHPGETIAFTGTRLVLVRIDVLLPDGGTAPEAKIHATKDRRNRSFSWTPDDPVIALEPGGWTVSAEGGPGETLASKETTLPLTPDQAEASLTLRLEERTGVRGTVAFPPHFRVSSVTVELEPLEGQTASRYERNQDTRVRPGGDRTFFFKDVPPGRYRVGIRGYDGPSTGLEVEVTEGILIVELTVPPPDPRSSVFVVVEGPGGLPVTDVSISGHVESSKGSASGGGSSVPIEPGRRYRYDFRGPDGWMDDDPETVRRWLFVSSSLYGSQQVDVPAGTREVRISFEEAARLKLTLTGLRDVSAHREMRVVLTDPGPGRIGSAGLRARPGGVLEIGPVQPGDYELVLTVPFGHSETLPLLRRSLSLPSGVTNLTIAVPGVHPLTVVWEGEGEAHFEMRRVGANWSTFPQGTEGGTLTWEGLPPGDYEVIPWGGSDAEPQVVRVPAQNRVVFRPPPPPDCFLVEVSGPGLLTEAGLADGDRIIGVDGEEADDLEKLEKLLAFAAKRESMKLIVLRGGQRVVIPLDASAITSSRDELGGRIRRGRR